MASFCIKLLFILIELGLAISFGITEYRGDYNKSAIVEWILALIFIFCESTLSDRLTCCGLANMHAFRCLVIYTGLHARNQPLAPWQTRSVPTCKARKRRYGDGKRELW